jgi:hypothetical protein
LTAQAINVQATEGRTEGRKEAAEERKSKADIKARR